MFRNRESSSASTRAAAPSKNVVICSICRDNVNANNMNSAKIDCSHTFHLKCIRKWIDAENHSCPNCRASVTLMKCGWRRIMIKKMQKKPSHSFLTKVVGWFTEVHGEPKQFI
ncbi:hypothetical protein PRIPAC_94434 [Pristionchus pacificus]|uniref:Zinc finger protein n=1 Tax=Pristionchus pacificus TaxID=54126 RepID=A0A2A6CDP8_PRIPA|nr:hypothetical protein PRIPAC_94434 [Pristionchus pacificus]|eukprot:PDM76246.1 zinc finger protein [Pristionchus pacificus]